MENWTTSKLPDNNQLVSYQSLLGDDDNYNQSFTPEIKFNYNNPSGLTLKNQDENNAIYNLLNAPKKDEFLASQLRTINDETNINLSEPNIETEDILKLISSNRELKNQNYAGAEMLLGRNLDDEEILRQSVTGERQYLKPPSRLERLISQSFVFEKNQREDMADLIKNLNDFKISYKINDQGDSVEIKTGNKKTGVVMPKTIVTEEKEMSKTETPMDYLKSIKLEPQSWKRSIDNLTGNYEELKKYATDVLNIGVENIKPRSDFKDNKQYLTYIRKEVKNFISNQIKGSDLPPLERVEGMGIKRAYKQTNRSKNEMIEFGKYFIDLNMLNKKGIVALKTAKRNPIYKLGKIMGSPQFNIVVKDFIKNNGIMDITLFESLAQSEQNILKRLLNVADVEYTFTNKKKKRDNGLNNDELQREFLEMYGSFLNGNNSRKLVEKINEALDILFDRGLVTKKDILKIQHKIFGAKI